MEVLDQPAWNFAMKTELEVKEHGTWQIFSLSPKQTQKAMCS